ncbi:MAG TPA: LytTR family DNA-binding domain-containing protein [Bacteroidales bacterium]|nr:LytTR family DNA-binding domain-containing protein [Bacteroidales bacterium]
MKIVIIEDEKRTAEDLAETILKLSPEVQIVARLSSVKDSVAWFKRNEQPDLIFSDIQLGDGLCFEIFKKQSITTPVIFCTAFDEYALTAFKSHGIDYILKPFDEATVASALNRYKELEDNFMGNNQRTEKIFKLFENRQNQRTGSVLVYHKDKILPVRIEDIALLYIEHEITYLITFAQKTFTINKSLEELEEITPDSFYRASRQFLVNRKAIKEVSQYFARKLSVTLVFPFDATITISKVKVSDFLKWLSEN